MKYLNKHHRFYLFHFKLKHIWKICWGTREKHRWKRPIPLLRYPRNEHQLKEKKSIKCCSGSKWDHKNKNGQRKPIWEAICYSLDCAMKRHVRKFLCTWESIEDMKIWTKVCGEEIIIEQVFISRQFNVSVEGVVDEVNALVKETQIVLKNIIGLYAFMEKE